MEKQRLWRWAVMVLAIVCVWGMGAGSWAADPATLAKELKSELRQAEKFMFGGKNQEALEILDAAGLKLEELKKADPGNKALRSLTTKYERTRQQVEKKLGINKPASTTGTKAAPPPKPESATKPSSSSGGGYRQQMRDRAVKKLGKDVDYELKRARESLEPRQYGGLPSAERAAEALGYIATARSHVTKLREKYPDLEGEALLVENLNKIDTLEAEIAVWKQEQGRQEAAVAQERASSAAAAADRQARLAADAALMADLHARYHAVLEPMRGASLLHNMQREEIQQARASVQAAERAVPEFATELGFLAEKYGTESAAIYNSMHAQGYRLEHGEEIQMANLLKAVANVPRTRQATAAAMAEHAGALLGAFSGQLTDHRLKRMNEAKALLLEGRQFDPANEQIQEMLGQIDDQMAVVADRMAAKIDATVWQGHSDTFAGPGQADMLAAAAVDYFWGDRDWGQQSGKDVEILAVSVRGPWQVAETDVFGRVVQWRLPIHVGVTDNQLKPRGLARVYDLSILAKIGGPGNAPQKPPYDGYWVGESWMMRLKNLP